MSDFVSFMRKSVTIPAACRERYVSREHPAMAGWKRAAVSYCGVSDLVPGYRIINPKPPELMLIATTDGRGWAATPAGTVALDPGSLFIGVPGEPVGWGIDGDSWRIVWWYLRPTALWRALIAPHGSLRRYARADLLARLVDDLIDRLAGPSDIDHEMARLHADTLLLHLRELAGAAPAVPDADPFGSLWQEVARNLSEPWSVPGLAARLGLSVSSIQREAKRRFGRSLHQELIHLRMAQAQQTLRRTTYPLAVIAELVGFADPYTFSAAYRRWSGKPPSVERLSRR